MTQGKTVVRSVDDRAVAMILALEHKLGLAESRVALDLLREALARHPGDPRILGRLERRLATLADWRHREMEIAAIVGSGRNALSGITALHLSDDRKVHRVCAENEIAHLSVPGATAFHHLPGQSKDILRIGYLTSDFNRHPVSQLIVELFELHDRRRVATTGYALKPSDGSDLRCRIEAGVDRFVDLSGVPAKQAAAHIQSDGIDILVEISATFKDLGILSLRPAPVQVSFLGYPSTRAASFIDYLIGDPIVFGDGAAEHFTEQLVVLPETYQPNDSQRPVASTRPTRRDVGLPENAFAFCCFNSPYKIRPPIFDVWMRLLARVDGSVLWLIDPWSAAAENLRREAAERSVDPARLIFAPRLPLADHLARLGLADVALDTLPYGAHTTGSDALWAGVPMLTCLGTTFAGRVGASLLNAVGLPEMIAPDLASYEALAAELAADRDRLASLRLRLNAMRSTAPLFDCRRFARHLETAYETMWAIHCADGRPRAFGVMAAA